MLPPITSGGRGGAEEGLAGLEVVAMSVAHRSPMPPSKARHRWGSERLSRKHFHPCPVAPHGHGDSVGLRKRDGFNLFLPLFLQQTFAHKGKVAFPYTWERHLRKQLRLLLQQAQPAESRGVGARSPAKDGETGPESAG